MQSLVQLFDFVGPEGPSSSSTEPQGSRRLLLAAVACLAAIAFAGVWGVAAGSHAGRLAFDNAVKVPMLLVVSSLAALPASLLLFRLTARKGRVTDLLVGHSAGMFTGTLVLALLAPLVALYQYSSAWAGPMVAFVSAVIGILVGVAIAIRVLRKLLPGNEERRGAILPVGLLVVLQTAALLQLASMTSAVFPTRTMFGRGIDAISQTEATP
jgi:hypothetical protein